MYVLLFLLLAVAAYAQSRVIAPFPNPSGRWTCTDSTARKDLYGGRYYANGVSISSFSPVRDTTTLDLCYQKCIAEPKCASFTWYKGPCNLFLTAGTRCNRFEGGSSSAQPYGVFTGISLDGHRTCGDSVCRADLYAGKWVNCAAPAGKPALVPYTTVANEAACATEALKYEGCTYFTFYPGGICNLFVPGTADGICVEGYSQGTGSWFRYGNAIDNNVVKLDAEETKTLDATQDKSEDPHVSVITGLSVGLGVAAFLVLALSGVVIALLVKWGKRTTSEEENSVQLM